MKRHAHATFHEEAIHATRERTGVLVELDAYYESVTVRIWASMRDSVVNEAGDVVGDDRKQARRFTEYWTFLRRSGARRPAGGTDQCPSCGAALELSLVGICGYCQTKVVSGDFGWVLSAIE